MQSKLISGIQQMGIGVKDVRAGWKWYADVFGTDVKVFDDAAVAELMLPYTGGEPRERHAALAINLQGGGGFEIWQYRGRVPVGPDFEPQLGDFGIYICKIKSKDVAKTYDYMKSKNVELLSEVVNDPNGNPHFFLKDPFGNIFQVVPGEDWFREENKLTGGNYGAVIGVSDIDKALKVYSGILNYKEVVYDKTGKFDDLKGLPSGDCEYRRVLLQSGENKGGFSKLLGPSQIELVEAKERTGRKIFENRFWGDLGYIHLCYDVVGMDLLREECKEKGFPFTVDSSVKHNNDNSFDMGEAAGHFTYIEDPDGTLIEFVETHKVPIIKKIGWFLNVRKNITGI